MMDAVTTIGYGDITPQTFTEIGIVMLFMLTGVAYFGWLIGYAIIFFYMISYCYDTSTKQCSALLQCSTRHNEYFTYHTQIYIMQQRELHLRTP